MVSFTVVITIHVICDVLFAYLSPLELVRMAKLSRTVRWVVQTYISHTFNPHRLLSYYFEDVLSFRTLQARTASLISGPSGLHFFDRTSHPSDSLHIHVYFHHRREVVSWLLRAGYTFVPSPGQSPNVDLTVTQGIAEHGAIDAVGLCGILWFQLSGGASPRSVCVYVALRTPIEVILLARSTSTMNVISYEKAYCLFPRATLHENRSLVLNPTSIESPDYLAELQERGYEVWDGLETESVQSPQTCSSVPLGWRWIDDSASWVIDFHTEDIQLPPSRIPSPAADAYDPVAVCGFLVHYNQEWRAQIVFSILSGPHVQYAYALGDRDLLDRIQLVMQHYSPVWDGQFWDQEMRRICRDALLEFVNSQARLLDVLR